MVARHGAALLRVANQFSLCHDDALDAYQRALGDLPAQARHASIPRPRAHGCASSSSTRRWRSAARGWRRSTATTSTSTRASPRRCARSTTTVAGGERVDRSVEALRALKPDEARALLLKAEGLSYQEIGRRFGWTYTKVNRSITEGRARFLKAFSGIEAGEACERHEAVLSALAGGHRDERRRCVSIRPHLRHCATCRAAVREMRFSRARRLALLLPFGVARAAARPLGRRHGHAVRGLGRRRAPRPGGGAGRAVPERRRCGRGVRDDRRAAGAADHRPRREQAGGRRRRAKHQASRPRKAKPRRDGRADRPRRHAYTAAAATATPTATPRRRPTPSAQGRRDDASRPRATARARRVRLRGHRQRSAARGRRQRAGRVRAPSAGGSERRHEQRQRRRRRRRPTRRRVRLRGRRLTPCHVCRAPRIRLA